MNDIEIRDNPDAARFETTVDGQTAVLDYRLDDRNLRLTHTGVPPELEGRGIGGRLVRHALDDARERGLQVLPECPFVAAYIRRHPEDHELLPDGYTLPEG